MNLYVFKAVGEYFGGAIGVVAGTPERARELLEAEGRVRHAEDQKNSEEMARRWHPNSTFRPTAWEDAGESRFAPGTVVLAGEMPRTLVWGGREEVADHWALTHTFRLADAPPEGLAFEEWHEG